MKNVDFDRFTDWLVENEETLPGFIFHMKQLQRSGWTVTAAEADVPSTARPTYPSVYTVKEVAAILRVLPGVIYREISKCRFHATKVGKRYRIHEDSIERYMKPWEEQVGSPSQHAPTCVKTTSAGSSSTGANKFPRESAVEAANRLLKKR